MQKCVDSEMQETLKCKVSECEVLGDVKVPEMYRLRDARCAKVHSIRVWSIRRCNSARSVLTQRCKGISTWSILAKAVLIICVCSGGSWYDTYGWMLVTCKCTESARESTTGHYVQGNLPFLFLLWCLSLPFFLHICFLSCLFFADTVPNFL